MTIIAGIRGHLAPPRDPGLVLTRRAGETIVIPLANGRRIVITTGGTIKLHFAAPPDIKILRGELVASPEAA